MNVIVPLSIILRELIFFLALFVFWPCFLATVKKAKSSFMLFSSLW